MFEVSLRGYPPSPGEQARHPCLQKIFEIDFSLKLEHPVQSVLGPSSIHLATRPNADRAKFVSVYYRPPRIMTLALI